MARDFYNVNVGVLGHVDSGKTSLVAALSTTLSTAALDKNPQSKERGITLDLGFSSFTVPAPPHIAAVGYGRVQFTLVDCPGHASLIRTIIGGAQIIDLMLLVVDAAKGIQPQTAECIVIGEVAAGDMVVALNKIDQFPAEKRERFCRKAQKLVGATLGATRFAACPVVPVAARPGVAGDASGDGSAATAGAAASAAPIGVEQLVGTLLSRVRLRPGAASAAGTAGGGSAQEPFLFYIDHCFAIRGQGTVLTGTVMRGSLRVGDTLELPELRVQKKAKSMQMFKQPVQACASGDRCGICVTQLDAKLVERGLACAPGSVPTFEAAVASVEKIRFYSGELRSRSKMHVTVGHATVMADLLFFGLPDGEGEAPEAALAGMQARLAALSLPAGSGEGDAQQQQHQGQGQQQQQFDSRREYLFQDCLHGLEGRPPSAAAGHHPADQQQQQQVGSGEAPPPHYGPQWAYLRFSQPVTAPADSLVIGSKLDVDLHAATCRLAFAGRLCAVVPDPSDQSTLRSLLPIFKHKQREGVVERVEADGCTAICRGMFQKETDLARFSGMRVAAVPGGQQGRIEGGFGKSGKFRVHFPGGAPRPQPGAPPPRLLLSFKKFLFDDNKRRMAQ
ncbi:Selenocysteine-specific elongation factor [Micractinium conductrix]|uniref:Selenocysteine-specific elongation factor n=1 Tax=Micractinium conductrix TaxID=554055 RepID=A0A2P6VBS2_9CHLO|nr:Selenocysteine-specific elongation factor [Micractinium conductrix]|eukprot:PSC71534.1 Selenocysteine-specific elongation factor [Micractinium conductrix]